MSNIIERITQALDTLIGAEAHAVILDYHDGRAFHELPPETIEAMNKRVPIRVGGKALRHSCVVTSSDWDELVLIHTI